MKLVIDDACYAYDTIFGDFGEICSLPGRNIDKAAVKEADVLIVRSRTKVNQALLDGSKVKFVGSTVAGLDHVDQDYLQDNDITFFLPSLLLLRLLIWQMSLILITPRKLWE